MVKKAAKAAIIAQTNQGQALSIFMSGIYFYINTILEARTVNTFKLAVVIAIEKERNFEERKPKFEKNKNKNYI